MECRRIGVCVIVGLLGAVAAVLSFAAEIKRFMASQAGFADCDLLRSTALGLTAGAALALLFSQIIISFETGCFTSKYAKLPIDWSSAKRNSFISRTAFGIAIVMVIVAGARTGQNGDTEACLIARQGEFASAGIFSLMSVAFGVLFYLTLSAGIEASNTNINPQAGINFDVEQPQIPANKPY